MAQQEKIKVMELIIGNTPEIISKSQAIRHQVFTREQCIPIELELDGLDEHSYHALITDNGVLVGTARLTVAENKNAVLARVAVVKQYRGSSISTRLITTLMSYARKNNLDTIEIHAHLYLREYYERFGFEYIQDVEIVGEHQLIEMRYQIKNI